jgi:hypothetical protein
MNTNPISAPPVPRGLVEFALQSGQRLVHVSLCKRPTAAQFLRKDIAELEGTTFWALADFAPRVGEYIRTEDDRFCKITFVTHSVRSFQLDAETTAFMLVIWVAAVLDQREEIR